MEDHESRRPSIIHGSTVHSSTKINPTWPPPRRGEELMFPPVHIGHRHWVGSEEVRAFRVTTQYTLLTPMILDYCHVSLMLVIAHRPGPKGPAIVSWGRLTTAGSVWLNTAGDNKRLRSFFFSDTQMKFSGQRNQIWSNHRNYDTFGGVIHIIIIIIIRDPHSVSERQQSLEGVGRLSKW